MTDPEHGYSRLRARSLSPWPGQPLRFRRRLRLGRHRENDPRGQTSHREIVGWVEARRPTGEQPNDEARMTKTHFDIRHSCSVISFAVRPTLLSQRADSSSPHNPNNPTSRRRFGVKMLRDDARIVEYADMFRLRCLPVRGHAEAPRK